MPSFSPYRFRQRVRLQALGPPVPGPGGDPVIDWAERGTVMAEVVPLAGRELLNALQVKATTSHRLTCRWFSGGSTGPPSSAWRGLWNGQVLNFDSVIDPDSGRRFWVILATVTPGETP